MDKIMLSNYQANIIRYKRKEAKIRTDVLSREIGKGSAYISQIGYQIYVISLQRNANLI